MEMLQVRHRMRHVLFAGEEVVPPDHLALALDVRRATHIGGQFADQQFRSQRAGAQFRVREIEIVLPLCYVIGELIAQRITDAPRPALFVVDIDADDLRLFRAGESKPWQRQWRAWRYHASAHALEEPFRHDADLVLARLAALDSHAE